MQKHNRARLNIVFGASVICGKISIIKLYSCITLLSCRFYLEVCSCFRRPSSRLIGVPNLKNAVKLTPLVGIRPANLNYTTSLELEWVQLQHFGRLYLVWQGFLARSRQEWCGQCSNSPLRFVSSVRSLSQSRRMLSTSKPPQKGQETSASTEREHNSSCCGQPSMLSSQSPPYQSCTGY